MADVVNDFDDIFGQEALWEGDDGFSFTADDCSVTDTSSARLSKTVPTSGSEFVDLVNGLVDEV